MQVQDVRLDLLEQGPTVTLSDIVMEIALTLILEGTFSGKTASTVLRPILRGLMHKQLNASASASVRVMEAERFRLQLGLTDRRLIVSEQVEKIRPRLEKTIRQLEGQIDLASARRISRDVVEISDLLGENAVAGVKSVRAAKGKADADRGRVTAGQEMRGGNSLTAAVPARVSGDSPGVGVVTSVLSTAAKLRTSLVLCREDLEWRVWVLARTNGDLADILSDAIPTGITAQEAQ